MSLVAGTKLGPYEIQLPLGAGGMGEVYRARDTRLDRIVAIKVLPQHSSTNPAYRQRFEREAKAISALQHPNICTLYDIGHQDGIDYLVMEYLQGQTLAARLVTGALPIEQVLRYGIEVADALDTAHRRGIIHRDLKPSNIMLTAHGECKVLDFGLAKLSDEAADSNAETVTGQQALTSPGVALGTVAYMSPEQVRGDDVDARSDIFSLGTVLYEMACGKLPFYGKTSGLIFKAILDEAPAAPTLLNAAVPIQLDQIIGKALEKDRELRYQSAADLRTDLKRVKRDTESAHHVATGTQTRQPIASHPPLKRWLGVAGSLAILVALGIGAWWYRQRTPALPELHERQITTSSTENPIVTQAISPDGKYVAYTDDSGLHLRVIKTGEEHDLPVPGEAKADFIAWVPDGNSVLVTVVSSGLSGAIWKVPILGGSPSKFRDHALFPAFSPDGSRVAFVTDLHEVWVMDPQGENAQRLWIDRDNAVFAPQWSPDGRYLTYMRGGPQGSSVEVRKATGEFVSAVASGSNLEPELALCWLPDWRLIYSMTQPGRPWDSDLFSAVIDRTTGHPTANSTQLTHWNDHYPAYVNATADGKTLSVVKANRQFDVYVGRLLDEGKTLEQTQRFTLDERNDIPDTWMPDSRSLLFESNRSGVYNIYRQDLGKQKAESFIGAPEIDATGASLSPDGMWVLFISKLNSNAGHSSGHRLMRAPLAGGAPEVVINDLPPHQFLNNALACPHAQASCVLAEQTDKQLIFYALDPLKGKGNEVARSVIEPNFNYGWGLSPDGSKVAVVSSRGSFVETIDLRTGAQRDIAAPADWTLQSVTWSADGKALFTTGWTQQKGFLLGRIELTGAMQTLKTLGIAQWVSGVVPSPDGRYLAYGAETFDNNIWLLESSR